MTTRLLSISFESLLNTDLFADGLREVPLQWHRAQVANCLVQAQVRGRFGGADALDDRVE